MSFDVQKMQDMYSSVQPALRSNLGNMATGAGAIGAISGGFARANAQRASATALTTEGDIAQRQGFEQESQQRRAAGMALGRESAAMSQSGTGTGGSAGRATAQSATNMELDALNIRYKSQLQKWAYATQAGFDRYGARTSVSQGLMGGAATLLKGYAGNYVGAPGGEMNS